MSDITLDDYPKAKAKFFELVGDKGANYAKAVLKLMEHKMLIAKRKAEGNPFDMYSLFSMAQELASFIPEDDRAKEVIRDGNEVLKVWLAEDSEKHPEGE